MQHRPLRPFFYKPVAILGVPLRDWKISLMATFCIAVLLFFIWRTAFGIPVWFVGSLAFGLGLVSFFLWAHNSHKRGWLEYSVSYHIRELLGVSQNLLSEKPGRKRLKWITDCESGDKPKWFKS